MGTCAGHCAACGCSPLLQRGTLAWQQCCTPWPPPRPTVLFPLSRRPAGADGRGFCAGAELHHAAGEGALPAPAMRLRTAARARPSRQSSRPCTNQRHKSIAPTQPQARKIRHQLTQLGVPTPAPSSAPSAAASAASLPSAPPAPASLVGAAAAGAAGEPDPKSAFEPAELQRYQELRAKVTQLQGLQVRWAGGGGGEGNAGRLL